MNKDYYEAMQKTILDCTIEIEDCLDKISKMGVLSRIFNSDFYYLRIRMLECEEKIHQAYGYIVTHNEDGSMK